MGVYLYSVTKEEVLTIMRQVLGEHWSCKMTEVKEPHKDLIEAIEIPYTEDKFGMRMLSYRDAAEVIRKLDNAPVIIDAEGDMPLLQPLAEPVDPTDITPDTYEKLINQGHSAGVDLSQDATSQEDKLCEEMKKFRQLLNINGISWEDDSDLSRDLRIERTHFRHRDCDWSVIHGYGTYGGYNRVERDMGLLELMSIAVRNGEPVGYLTAEAALTLVMQVQPIQRES